MTVVKLRILARKQNRIPWGRLASCNYCHYYSVGAIIIEWIRLVLDLVKWEFVCRDDDWRTFSASHHNNYRNGFETNFPEEKSAKRNATAMQQVARWCTHILWRFFIADFDECRMNFSTKRRAWSWKMLENIAASMQHNLYEWIVDDRIDQHWLLIWHLKRAYRCNSYNCRKPSRRLIHSLAFSTKFLISRNGKLHHWSQFTASLS